VRAATAVILLSPALPLLFMGQEWAAPEPFLFFSDLGADLGLRVSEGRRREFARFPEFANAAMGERMPDPQAESTFKRSVLDWSHAAAAVHKDWLGFHQTLLALRARAVAPLLAGEPVPVASWKALGDTALEVVWRFPGAPCGSSPIWARPASRTRGRARTGASASTRSPCRRPCGPRCPRGVSRSTWRERAPDERRRREEA